MSTRFEIQVSVLVLAIVSFLPATGYGQMVCCEVSGSGCAGRITTAECADLGGVTSVPGGACGDDADADSVPAGCDNCPDKANANQNDCDADGTGNACDYCMGWYGAGPTCLWTVGGILGAITCLEDPDYVSWCDFNEDGVSDTVDFSAAFCQYNGGAECCSLPSGACCGYHHAVITSPALEQPCFQAQEAFCNFGNGNYLGDGVSCPPSCASGDDCASDLNACTCETCDACCISSTVRYGNVNCTGPADSVDLDDILCCLNGFASSSNCPNADIHPPCTGNGIISLDDVLALLSTFTGADPCACLD